MMETKKQVAYKGVVTGRIKPESMKIQERIERTNGWRAKHDQTFIKCCERAKTPPTARQFSKYKRGLGLAAKVKLLVKRETLQSGNSIGKDGVVV